jgi:hypothetical protein
MKIKQLALIILLCTALIACKHEKSSQEMPEYYGVWASENAELVQTEKYTLIFYRNRDIIGEEYLFSRPQKGDVQSVEWFEYDPY